MYEVFEAGYGGISVRDADSDDGEAIGFDADMWHGILEPWEAEAMVFAFNALLRGDCLVAIKPGYANGTPYNGALPEVGANKL